MSRYLNRSPLEIEELLDSTMEGAGELVVITNEFNELLYDEISQSAMTLFSASSFALYR